MEENKDKKKEENIASVVAIESRKTSGSGVSDSYDRKVYEDRSVMDKFKDKQFGGSKTINNPYGDEVLHKSHSAAKNKYRSNASQHQAETDHITPLKHIYDEATAMTYITDADIKAVANRESNLKVIDKKTNASKGEKTNFEVADGKSADVQLKMKADAMASNIKVTGELLSKDIYRAAVDGAVNGLTEGAQTVLCINIAEVVQGNKTIDEAMVDTITGTAQTTVVSATASATTELIKVGAENGRKLLAEHVGASKAGELIGNTVSHSLKWVSGNAGNIVATAIAVGESLVRYAEGKIDGEQLVAELGEKGTATLAMAAGKEIGGIIGFVAGSSLPVVGNYLCMIAGEVIGSVIGYIIGSKVFRMITGPSKSEQLKKIRREYEKLAEQIEASRLVLEQYLDYVHAEHRLHIWQGLEGIYYALLDENVDRATESLSQICTQFGTELEFKTKNEFDDFMADSAQSFKLGISRKK